MPLPESDSETLLVKPEYASMFLERPQDVVKTLDELYRSKSSIAPVFESIPWGEITDEAFVTMTDTGVPDLLLRILGDAREYESVFALEAQAEQEGFDRVPVSPSVMSRPDTNWLTLFATTTVQHSGRVHLPRSDSRAVAVGTGTELRRPPFGS